MCGIAGFLHGRRRPDAQLLRRTASAMADAIRHRGPDAQGVWVDADAGVAFGHRRLSVIDLSEAGSQPMISRSGRYVLVYNGEIYNFRVLMRELEEGGHRFSGHCDTEVLLAGIDTWGMDKTLERANGMFAFALWDRRERMLTLARDRVGKKPLYYGWSGDVFLFASELRALGKHPEFAKRIDRGALGQLLRNGWIAQPRCIFEGINKLPPGSTLDLDPRRSDSVTQPRCHWSARAEAEFGDQHRFDGEYGDAVDELDTLLRSAVAERMVADVDLGALLSGGIDSSVVVAIMQALGNRPVKTFSVGFNEPRYDEAPHAARIAAHLETDHHEVYLTPAECLKVVEELPLIYDEPFADPSQIPSYLISRVAREQVTVVLSGDGGDELFAGYKRYEEILDFWDRWGGVPAPLRGLAGAVMMAAGRGAWRFAARRRTRENAVQPAGRCLGSRWERDGFRFAARSPRDLLARQMSSVPQPHALLLEGRPAPSVLDLEQEWAEVSDPLQALMHLDFGGYLPDDILVKLDRASMAASLEARCPLLDYRVARFAWRLPRSMRRDARGGKRILRDVLGRYVPPAMTERAKQGFSVPIAQWLRGPLKEWAEDALAEERLTRQGLFDPVAIRRLWDQHRTGWRNHTKLIWAVLVYQSWAEEYL